MKIDYKYSIPYVERTHKMLTPPFLLEGESVELDYTFWQERFCLGIHLQPL